MSRSSLLSEEKGAGKRSAVGLGKVAMARLRGNKESGVSSAGVGENLTEIQKTSRPRTPGFGFAGWGLRFFFIPLWPAAGNLAAPLFDFLHALADAPLHALGGGLIIHPPAQVIGQAL